MLRLREGVRLVHWADLPAGGQAAVKKMTGQDSVPALLIPKAGHGTVKAIDANLLHLLENLAQSLEVSNIDRAPNSLKALILDEVVELRTPAGFVSGPEAAPLITPRVTDFPVDDPIAQLSLEAIRYAATLPVSEPRLLSARLYRYNTMPCSTDLRLAFGSAPQIAGMMGLAGSSPLLQRLTGAEYDRVDHIHWHAWSRRSHVDDAAIDKLRYKLYVSPDPRTTVDVVERTVGIAIELKVPSFKLGKSLANLLRPDKFILYTDSSAALDVLATELSRELAEYPVQGVPFTKCIDGRGMLSTGADPPRSLCLSGWAQAESWRAWIADRLALAILQARAFSKSASAHCEFALGKLSVEGIDTRDWTPYPELWQGESS